MERCEVTRIHPQQVAAVQQQLPTDEALIQLADWFRLLADPARLRTLLALNGCELCVCDIAAVQGTTVSAASHQLRLLRAAGLVACRKAGKMVYYRAVDERVQQLLGHELDRLRKKG